MNGERVIVPAEMQTERLKLRRWHPDDLQYYAALNADPQVMEYFPKVLSPVESDQSAARIQKHFEENQFGLWALEVPGKVSFIGFTGLMRTPFDAAFTPCVEVGWRVARHFGDEDLRLKRRARRSSSDSRVWASKRSSRTRRSITRDRAA